MSALANWYPGPWVLDFCVIAAATVILVTTTAWMVSLFQKRHPAIRHWVLLSALVASLASPFLAVGFIASGRSFINVPLLIAEDTAVAPELPDEVNPSRNRQAEHGHARLLDEPAPSVAPETFLQAHRTGPAKAKAVLDKVATAEPKSPKVDPATGLAYPYQSALVTVLLMWLCGTLVVILGLFRGVLFLRRLCRSVRPMTDAELGHAIDEARRLVGARSSPAIGVSSLARSPLVAGLFRPIIVIPRNLLGAIGGHQLRDILMHEMAHVERRDNLVVLLQAIAKAAFWPIPFVHLLNRELERAREEICDNHVLACRDAVSYGETLLRVAHLACETGMPVGTVGILHWRGKLEDRIFGLLHNGRSKMTRMHPLIALGVLALFLSASAILCGTTIVAAQPPPTASDKPAVAQEPPVTPQKPEKVQEKEAFTAWGKEVGGLQAGLGFRPGEQRAYRHGETATLVVRVRNVGKENVKFQYLKEFFMEKPPTVTGGEGKTIRFGGVDLFGRLVHIPVDVNLAPGKEMELHDLKFKLGPASEGGDVTEVSPDALHGKGKFQIQYERVFGNSSAAGQIKLDPNLSKLATGKLELEVKEAEKQEKEGFTAWGKERGGLQVGLGYHPGQKRAYSHGETVTLVVRVRNVGKEEVTVDYIPGYFVDWPPSVTDGEGKTGPQVRVAGKGGDHNPVQVKLAPGKEIELAEVKLELRPASESGNKKENTLYGTGKFQIHYERLMYGSGAVAIASILRDLATGKLDLEVKTAPPKPEKKQEQEGFTAWGNEINGLQAGLGFLPGEKRPYRHGEAVKVVLRVRNVGKEAVEFKHIWAFFVENPPKITDAVGKMVQLPNYRTRDQGLHMPRSSNVAPGKEVELYEWTFDLQPNGENSSRSFIHGTGKFSLQCERIVGPTWLNPDHPNPAMNKIATGKLELEVQDAERLPEKKDEKEAFTAWGKEVDGVQAGLGYLPGARRAYAPGETVRLVVRVRNLGKKDVKFVYAWESFYEEPPVVTDGAGKPVPFKPGGFSGEIQLKEVKLAPGKEADLCEVNVELRPAREKGNARPWSLYETGKFQLQFERVGGNIGTGEIKFDPILSKLVTGKLELDIKSDPAAAPEKQGAQAAKLQPGTEEKLEWGEPASGLRLALAWPPTLGEPAAGEVPDFFLAVQNVSKAPVRLCTTADAPNKRRLTISTDFVPQSRTEIEAPSGVDVTLEPREVVFLRLYSEPRPDQPSRRGSLVAAGVKQTPTRTLLADMEIKKAPKGAWTGMLTTPNTRAGIVAEAPKNR